MPHSGSPFLHKKTPHSSNLPCLSTLSNFTTLPCTLLVQPPTQPAQPTRAEAIQTPAGHFVFYHVLSEIRPTQPGAQDNIYKIKHKLHTPCSSPPPDPLGLGPESRPVWGPGPALTCKSCGLEPCKSRSSAASASLRSRPHTATLRNFARSQSTPAVCSHGEGSRFGSCSEHS